MEQQKISIIIPIYNREKYVAQCIQSAVDQSYQNIEILLVNDGSTDGSKAICEEFAQKDKRIQVIHQENQGRVVARNQGLLKSTGDYIFFLDSDDWIEPNAMEKMLDEMIEQDVDVVQCAMVIFGESYRTEEMIESGYYVADLESENSFWRLLEEKRLVHPKLRYYLAGKLFKKHVLFDVMLGFDINIELGEDAAQLICILSKVQGVYIGCELFYHYRQHDESTIHTVICDESTLLNFNHTLNFVKRYYENRPNEQIAIQYICHHKKYCLYGMLNRYLDQESFFMIRKMRLDTIPLTIPQKVVLYGMGDYGKRYLYDLEHFTPHSIVALVDQNLAGTSYQNRNIQSPELLSSLDFDAVLIAVFEEELAERIKRDLIQKYQIPAEKLVWSPPISTVSYLFDG